MAQKSDSSQMNNGNECGAAPVDKQPEEIKIDPAGELGDLFEELYDKSGIHFDGVVMY